MVRPRAAGRSLRKTAWPGVARLGGAGPGGDNEGMPARLDDAAVSERLASLTGWSRDGDTIVKDFQCASFPDAIAFVVRIGFFAEAANHHPDIDIRWRNVHVALTTHDAGGLSALDFDLAGEIDGVGP
jgi:4a-hydroxytetrahydrobiopterin dehydratase